MRTKVFSQKFSLAMVAISFIIAAIFIYISSLRDLTNLENLMFQVFILMFSITGSYQYARIFEKNDASEVIKPYARPAFRRVLSLYGGLSRIAKILDDEREKTRGGESENNVLVTLSAVVYEHICTVDDAVEDWRDIIPEDVKELEKIWSNKNKMKTIR